VIQDVFIIGATGNVGKELVKQIVENDISESVHANPTRIVGLASSRSYVYHPYGLNDRTAISFSDKLLDPNECKGYSNYFELLRLVNRNGETPKTIFIDTTSVVDPMIRFHTRIIKHEVHGIVTANKNPLALGSFDTFELLTSRVERYGFSCTVMAGAEIVNLMRDLRDVNDRPTKIMGALSGTLGYIASRLENGDRFSAVVTEAKENGYTEPHPGTDLGGTDVRNKILIIARTAGLDVKPENITLEPLIDRAYLSIRDVPTFMARLPELDEHFEELFIKAREASMTLRYMASLDNTRNEPRIKIGLQEVAKDSPMGLLRGTDNKVMIETFTYGKGYIIQAAGAGIRTTAQNIRRDLLGQLVNRQATNYNGVRTKSY
jgi:homoserine dehydrogenase